MLDDFLTRAALASLGVSLSAAPLGCFLVWRRMAFFGDAAAHASILGVALALATDLPILAGVALAALAMGLAVSGLTARGHTGDASLGVLAHGALAFGLVAASFIPGIRLDLSAYLFGDVLAVSLTDLAAIWAGALAACALVAWRWQALLTATLSPDLAHAEGVAPQREQLILTLALALVIAVALKVVGALLIAALMVVPAAAARAFARTPEAMVVLAGLIAGASSLGGLWAAWELDAPAGPSIVAVAATLFAAVVAAEALRARL
ncbi:MAG: metal ABC transporter permease [Pseudomonadota bacterium]